MSQVSTRDCRTCDAIFLLLHEFLPRFAWYIFLRVVVQGRQILNDRTTLTVISRVHCISQQERARLSRSSSCMKLRIMDLLLFATTASLSVWQAKAATSGQTCDSTPGELRNSAFVFVKPHANTVKVQDLVRKTLQSKGVSIIQEVSIPGDVIDSKKLIDQHYYAIGTLGLDWIGLDLINGYRSVCL